MRVLFQARINLFSTPGGDTIQILKTREYLEKLGIRCDLSTSINAKIEYEKYDLVHLFNVTRIQETYWYARKAKQANKPVILSTIYWDNKDVEKLSDIGFRSMFNKYLTLNQIEFLKGLGRLILRRELNKPTLYLLYKGFRQLQLDLLNYVDYYLPNAEIEMEMFHRQFSSHKQLPYSVIPNAVEIPTNIEKNNHSDYKKFENCVLCVGRIDPRKNQLNLVRALKESDLKVVFVGQPAPNHRAYMKKIEEEKRPGMYFLGWINHDEITELYKLARVHICPSWYETPGLVSLEAGVSDCNIVVTDLGSTREYFGSLAYYCKPDSIISIHDEIIKAYNTPIDKQLKDRILKNYTWEKTAEKTAVAYKTLLHKFNKK